MPDAPAPAPIPGQELDHEPGLRDLLTALADNVQSIQDRGVAADVLSSRPGGHRGRVFLCSC